MSYLIGGSLSRVGVDHTDKSDNMNDVGVLRHVVSTQSLEGLKTDVSHMGR